MKKSILSILALSAVIFSSSIFAQDTTKHSMKSSKTITHKVTTHHKTVKKTRPAM